MKSGCRDEMGNFKSFSETQCVNSSQNSKHREFPRNVLNSNKRGNTVFHIQYKHGELYSNDTYISL